MATPLDAVQAGPADVTSPAPVDTSALPVNTPQSQVVQAPPDASAVQAQPLNDNQPTESNPAAEAQAPRGSMWKTVLIGALQGLAAGGAVRGAVQTAATGQTPVERMRDANDQQQQVNAATIRFKDAQAAEAVAHATAYNFSVAHLPEEEQRAVEDHNQKLASFLYGLGWNPVSTVAHDEPNSGVAGLQHVAAQYGGEVPNTITLHVGNGATLVFAPPQQSAGGQQLEALNALQRTAALPETPSGMWAQMKPEDQFKLFSSALESNRAEVRPDMVPGAIARDQGILKQLQQVRPWDKSAISQVQSRLDVETQTQRSQQAEFNRRTAIKAQYEQQAAEAKQRNSTANQNFVDLHYIQPATTVEQSYQLFLDAYAHRNDPTGAASMAGLSTHLSTTFGSVKGSRITKDMIQEHLGARGVSDDALVAVQKLSTGSVLSPNQWEAFKQLIGSSRQTKWSIAAQQAMARHMSDSDIAARMPSDLVHTATNPKTGQKIISFAGGPWHISNGGQQ